MIPKTCGIDVAIDGVHNIVMTRLVDRALICLHRRGWMEGPRPCERAPSIHHRRLGRIGVVDETIECEGCSISGAVAACMTAQGVTPELKPVPVRRRTMQADG
jgi:hypothetical protein